MLFWRIAPRRGYGPGVAGKAHLPRSSRASGTLPRVGWPPDGRPGDYWGEPAGPCGTCLYADDGSPEMRSTFAQDGGGHSDRDRFRMDVFFNPVLLKVEDRIDQRYLPSQADGFSLISAIGAVLSGGGREGGNTSTPGPVVSGMGKSEATRRSIVFQRSWVGSPSASVRVGPSRSSLSRGCHPGARHRFIWAT